MQVAVAPRPCRARPGAAPRPTSPRISAARRAVGLDLGLALPAPGDERAAEPQQRRGVLGDDVERRQRPGGDDVDAARARRSRSRRGRAQHRRCVRPARSAAARMNRTCGRFPRPGSRGPAGSAIASGIPGTPAPAPRSAIAARVAHDRRARARPARRPGGRRAPAPGRAPSWARARRWRAARRSAPAAIGLQAARQAERRRASASEPRATVRSVIGAAAALPAPAHER